jgi:hypothetical protein
MRVLNAAISGASDGAASLMTMFNAVFFPFFGEMAD